jgi:hypothetical protein
VRRLPLLFLSPDSPADRKVRISGSSLRSPPGGDPEVADERIYISPGRQKRKETALIKPEFWEVRESAAFSVLPEEPELPELSPRVRKVLRVDQEGKVKEDSSRKRLYCLLLRNAHTVSPGLIAQAALLTGCDAEWLSDRVEEARMISFHRDGRRKMFIHRRRAALFYPPLSAGGTRHRHPPRRQGPAHGKAEPGIGNTAAGPGQLESCPSGAHPSGNRRYPGHSQRHGGFRVLLSPSRP